MTRVAIATCRRLPEPDPDQDSLLSALRNAGIEPRLLAWDDEREAAAPGELVVIRSTWNYFERVDDFVAWASRTSSVTRLLNPSSIVAWNAKKTYLAELEARGIAIVPTEFVRRGDDRRFYDIVHARGWDEIVIKPTVSAGSFRTERFSRTSPPLAAAHFFDRLVADRDVMVQCWMPSVEGYGERSLVWIDGEFTHAIRKSPRFANGSEHVSSAVPIADDERAFAERLIAPSADECLYARVDVVRDPNGELRLMELELIEPSLFFGQAPRALSRFVAAIARIGRSA